MKTKHPVIRPNGVVARSCDGQASWEPQVLPEAPSSGHGAKGRRAVDLELRGLAESQKRWFHGGTAALLEQVDWVAVRGALGLSAQEGVVVRHILQGDKLTAIAAAMGLGLGTVKTYSRRIHRKLGVDTYCALAIVVLFTHFLSAQSKSSLPAGLLPES